MSIAIHTTVHHNLYGKGEVVKLTSKNIYIKFEDGQRIFPFPAALNKGYIKIEENSTTHVPEAIPEKEKASNSSPENAREVILDVADDIHYTKIYEAINATVGTSYTGWMKAGWPQGNMELPFWIWFPKLAETKNGELVPASFDCVNTISDDWNELIFDNLKDTPQEIDMNWNTNPILIFAKEPKGGPYIFRGVYVHDKEKSRYRHHVSVRIGTKVKLIGQPSDTIVILDDFRNK